METTPRRWTQICGLVTEFTVCAFVGWLYEELLSLTVVGHYEDRGLLHLPVCPIYGFFGLILLLLFRRHRAWYLVFAVSTVLTTVLELACSYLLEWTLHVWAWDYSAWPLNFEGRISVPSSLIFGVLSVILVSIVHPLMQRFVQKAPAGVVEGVGCFLGGVLVWECVRTFAAVPF
ncbi:MAG: putative ABC transporter permease [Oscillospiraceae bacterium]|nr:putative ABC transporter permease [Oscillospiraceae bacterium]